MIPRSAVSGIRWPAVPNHAAARLLAVYHQLEWSEWLSPAELERLQLSALGRLLQHATRTVPHYRERPEYAEVAASPLTPDSWRRLPVLTRAELQDAGSSLRSESVPTDHLPLNETVTSGSTGRPVRAVTTAVTHLFWMALTLREQLWHGRDLTATLAAIRTPPPGGIPAGGARLAGWGAAVDLVYETGPCALFSVQQDVGRQAEWLAAVDPEYLLSLPSNLVALARHFGGTGARLSKLRQVCSYGEALGPHVRDTCRDAFGVELVDMYSSQEVGYLALQCPATEQYHVQSEAVRVDVLDDDGDPCRPGDIGRVVVTPLHNLAMPLVRYDLGDYAEVGATCGCGRGLPVLTRIVGRQRNMLTLPTGEQVWPLFGARAWAHIDAVRQLQVVQHDLDHLEARVVGPRPLTPDEEAELTAVLHQRLSYPFRLSFTYLDRIDREKGLKFEDFVSLV
ncbi:MAG TPA: AMP-binding protein [Acidimicrobiales bacterium]|nr:AMP-binding protein [Acidimicrobiales bacterium]